MTSPPSLPFYAKCVEYFWCPAVEKGTLGVNIARDRLSQGRTAAISHEMVMLQLLQSEILLNCYSSASITRVTATRVSCHVRKNNAEVLRVDACYFLFISSFSGRRLHTAMLHSEVALKMRMRMPGH